MNQTIAQKERIISVDMLRGWVMITMALDHTRDYTTYYHFNAEDLTQTTILLFITRWVTHFCAPVFVFVAGIGTGLGGINGKSKKQLSHFLWTRGVWLIILEFTVIKLGWTFNFSDHTVVLQVIWALGASMLALAALIHLSHKWILAIGIVMVFGHNLLDGVNPASLGWLSPIVKILHVRSEINFGPIKILTIYPLIPWIGVMALGYVFAEFYRLEKKVRQEKMLILGVAVVSLFILIRGLNSYGNFKPWSEQSSFVMTLASFLNVAKYPPSLSYLLMTLGPTIILLVVFEKIRGWFSGFLIVFGRVPMFYYIVHIYLIHLIAVFLGLYQGFSVAEMAVKFRFLPESYGFGLGVTYTVWLVVIAILYVLCRSYIRFKRGKTHPFFSYI